MERPLQEPQRQEVIPNATKGPGLGKAGLTENLCAWAGAVNLCCL